MPLHLLDEKQRMLILGAGIGGEAMLELFVDDDKATIVGIVDRNPDAPALKLAKQENIPVFCDTGDACRQTQPDLILNLTGDNNLDLVVASIVPDSVVVNGIESKLMWRMMSRLRHDQKLVFRLVSRLKRSQERQRYEASHDYLTNQYNRRYLMEQIHVGLAQALRYQQPYAVMLMDVDNFKEINDRYNHEIGDKVLQAFANHLRQQIRGADIVGRFGGDEFLVLLPQTTTKQAVIAGNKWLAVIAEKHTFSDQSANINVTFSGGAAAYEGGDAGNKSSQAWVDKLLHEADEYMYMAKKAGRNRVMGHHL